MKPKHTLVKALTAQAQMIRDLREGKINNPLILRPIRTLDKWEHTFTHLRNCGLTPQDALARTNLILLQWRAMPDDVELALHWHASCSTSLN